MPGIITGPGMAGVGGSGLPSGIDTAEARYAVLVSKGTGLTIPAVLAWVKAEGGPHGNPTNIGPGRDYGSPDAAAAATVSLLHTKLYAPVLATAKVAPNDTHAQLAAIANSPWDAGHYTGGQHGPTPGVPWGTTLFGNAAGIKGSNVKAVDAAGSTAPGSSDTSLLGGLTGWVGQLEKWITGQATTGLAYVVLTVLGIALVAAGLLETLGVSPAAGPLSMIGPGSKGAAAPTTPEVAAA